MMPLSPLGLDILLAEKARTYLTAAHHMDTAAADPIARQAAWRVMAGLRPSRVQRAFPIVVGVARHMALALPSPDGAAVRPPIATRCGRPMQRQPLDPLTLEELKDHSRQRGRWLVGRLPRMRSLVWGLTVAAISVVLLPGMTH
ncbi:hypothetical protein [Rhodospira trueperi]|nr:hypothetical protein [Rhodospira trueperi]